MQLPRRELREGIHLSIIGFGGMIAVGMDQPDLNALAAASFEVGLNYFDVAPFYGDGEAEEKLGIALAPLRREIFLACKTLQRDAAGAAREIEHSLRRLRTDHLDLLQFHAVTTMRDVDQIFAPNGAVEAFVDARREGKARLLGFSAHSVEAALAMINRFEFDTVLFPVNFVSMTRGGFGPQVLDAARRRGTARIALKSMALTAWGKHEKRSWSKCWYKPVDDENLARLALRFSLSEDVTSAIPPGEERLFRLAVQAATHFAPLGEEERLHLLARARTLRPLFKS